MALSEIHWEKELVINNRELKYSGIFKADEIFSTVNKALEERNYVKREKKSEETVTEAGRKSYIELRPYKMKTNYMALMIKIKINFRHTTDVIENKDGTKARFQKGDVLIVFDSWVLTDYEYRWGMKPWFFLLKGWVNKFVYAFPLEGKVEDEVSADTAFMYGRLKKLLQSYSGKIEPMPKEDEIRRKMEEEMKKEMEEFREK